jgi:pimeloyl-ACP methyl ester carboxylesterase
MGIGYDSTLWTLAQVPALSQKFQVVIFDNRDAGRSSQANSAYAIPGAEFEVIKGEGSSHVVPIERPADFNGLVTNFLS